MLVSISKNPLITIAELAEVIGVTERSIERNLKKLQTHQRLSRNAPAKGDYWVASIINATIIGQFLENINDQSDIILYSCTV